MGNVLKVVGAGCLLLLVAAVACGVGIGMGAGFARSGMPGFGRDAVAVVYVEGQIVGGDSRGLFDAPVAHSDRVARWLRRAGDDPSIKAVVLRVDSPGGGVTASDEIYNQVIKLKEKKPVVVSMGGLAASGGYYISAPANRIVANRTSLTGSIGVITIVPNIQGLLEKLGVETYVFTSGPHKDESAGLRPLTEADRRVFQGVVDEAFTRFVAVVSEGRGLTPDQVREQADGRIMTGRQALEVRLVDELGDLPEAVRAAADLGGIEGEPRIVRYRAEGGLFAGGTEGIARILGFNVPVPWAGGGQMPVSVQYLLVAP